MGRGIFRIIKTIEEQKMKKLPKGALRLVDVGHDCHAFADGDGEKKKLNMTIYSGKVIKGHWYWDDLAIDLTGIKFNEKKYPILEDHLTSKKIAFTGKPIIDEKGLHVNPDKTQFVSTDESEEFQKVSAEGFPFQASMYARPLIIERIADGASVKVNGFTLKGPATVWRVCEFKEGSVCVFGWDTKTQASAFSRTEEEELEYEERGLESAEELEALSDNEDELNSNEEEVNESMDINELKEKHPELFKQIQDDAVAGVESQFSRDLQAVRDENKKLSDKVLAGEKAEAIRAENDLKSQADKIWNDRLSASDLPERFYEKVQPHVSYDKFLENGKLDVEKFTEAVDAEIKDWVDRGASTSVMGSGFHSKEVETSQTKLAAEQEKSDEAETDSLLALAGQEQNQT